MSRRVVRAFIRAIAAIVLASGLLIAVLLPTQKILCVGPAVQSQATTSTLPCSGFPPKVDWRLGDRFAIAGIAIGLALVLVGADAGIDRLRSTRKTQHQSIS